ncbi:bacillithiol biosynthesis deacetylase BshB1 [Chitinophagaceae bacterium IBVUCB1]|nr:bacillithiol biosynthesis deacetylase BshB1 [Chitinophagaceae bacterium IBVUCB1]
MKLQVLAIAVHPDDIELSAAGTLIKHARMGQQVGIIDLTAGELGTRGTPQLRLQEAADAARIMGMAIRENLGMRDGFIVNDEAHQLQLIQYIRKYQPEIVIANAIADRHPDHGKAGRLIADACFLSGLRKIETTLDGATQAAWRPKRVYHMIQDRFTEPSFIVDVSSTHATKMEAVKAYKSQFHNPDSTEPLTYISKGGFLEAIEARAMLLGKRIGVAYGEGFVSENTPGIDGLDALLLPEIA